ncbi:MAG: hypothetical protein ACOY5U_04665 [Pseudomonadota bacterium]
MSGPAAAAALAFLTEIALLAGAVRSGLALALGASAWALADGAAAGLVFAAAAFLGLALGAPDRGAR